MYTQAKGGREDGTLQGKHSERIRRDGRQVLDTERPEQNILHLAGMPVQRVHGRRAAGMGGQTGILPSGGLRGILQMDGLSGKAGSVVVLPAIFFLFFFLICAKTYGTVVVGH